MTTTEDALHEIGDALCRGVATRVDPDIGAGNVGILRDYRGVCIELVCGSDAVRDRLLKAWRSGLN